MIKYRKSRKTDLKDLLKLDKLANKEIPSWKPLTLSQFLRIYTKYSIYLAVDNKKIIGYLSTEIKTQNKEKIIFLDNLYILKEYRKKGISKKLIFCFITDSKKKYNKIKLYCTKDLEKYYNQFGFKTSYLTMVLDFK